MMLDTLTISRELRKKGFNEAQAEALADAIHQRQENLATKDDITHLEDKIENVEKVLGERINSVEKTLGSRVTGLYWFIGIIMGIIGSAVVGQFVLALFS